MKKKRFWKSLVTTVLFLALLLPQAGLAVQNDANMKTLAYYVDAEVHTDGSADIKESITVLLNHRHGIIRNIPVSGKLSLMEGNELQRIPVQAKVSHVKVDGFPFTDRFSGNDYVLKIGNADQYLDGKQTFTLSYHLQPFMPVFDDKELVYFNLIGTAWQNVISDAKIRVHLPKAIPAEQINIYRGISGSGYHKVAFSQEKTTGDGMVIKAEVKNLGLGEGMTLFAPVEKGYFKDAPKGGSYGVIALVFSGIMLMISGYLFVKFSRDKKVIQTVEVRPRQWMDPLVVTMMIDHGINNKDMVAMLMELGNRGYLKIVDHGDKTYHLEKLKDADASESTHIKKMMKLYFEKSDTFAFNEDDLDFWEAYEDFITEQKVAIKDELESLESRHSRKIFRLLGILATIYLFFSIFYQIFWNPFSGPFLGSGLLVVIVGLIGIAGLTFQKKRWEKWGPVKRNISICQNLFIALFFFLACHLYATQIFSAGWIGIVMAAVYTAMSMMYFFGDQLSDIGRERRGQILGFKEFIKRSEIDRIKRLSDEDPQYFYKVLPYAYVFGFAKDWMNHFDGIYVPESAWGGSVASNMPDLFMRYTINQMSLGQYHFMKAAHADSGFGADDFFSGFTGGSSGGGFSGGGFGGGGGGSW